MIMLQAAFLATYWFRFYSGIWLVPLGIPPFGHVPGGRPGGAALVFLASSTPGHVHRPRGPHPGGRPRRAVQGRGAGQLLVLALAFFLRGLTFSRSFFGLFFLSTFIFLTLGRVLARVLLRSVLQAGRGHDPHAAGGGQPHARRGCCALVRELPGIWPCEPVGWLRVAG